MNTDNFNIIAENFVNEFDIMNNAEHREGFKWQAFAGFDSFREDFYNISVEDFPKRLKDALKDTGFLISNSTTWPTTGICKMAEYEPETVQNMFKDLYEEDGGDFSVRLDKINTFTDKVNKMLDQYAKGSWKYVHTMRDALAYLCLFRPSENYLYKYSFAKQMANALELADNVESGKYFSLKKYYEMCDAIKEALLSNEAIMEQHNKRKDITQKVDDDNNILVYDFIYCARTYGLYKGTNIIIPNRKKGTSANINDAKAIEAEVKELELKLEEKLNQLKEVSEEIEAFEECIVKDMEVYHKKFGEGTVIEQLGTRIKVAFKNEGEKLFVMPDVFANGYLTLNNQEMMNTLKEIFRLNEERKVIKKAVDLLTRRLEIIR